MSHAAPATTPRAGEKRAGRLPLLVAGALVALIAAPFALNLAGDAQVHLAIAERFATGRPFQYNPNGEIVVASTSPFWTMLLALLYTLVGPLTPAFLPFIALTFWLAAAYLLYRVAREHWGFQRAALWGVVLLWVAHVTIVANALGGLENVASALQLLWLYWLVADRRPPTDDGRRTTDDSSVSIRKGILIGVLLGWALLTRPDGGLFALFLFILALPLFGSTSGGQRPAVGRLLVVALAAAAVLLPWFAYQYAVTGQLLTDSSVARLYNGRMGALMIIPGRLYLHPKAIISLGTAFLPVAAGFLITAGSVLARLVRGRAEILAVYRECFPQAAAVALTVAGILFYTFIVGAEAFGRYFLPLFPFFFLAGVAGLTCSYNHLVAVGRRRSAVAFIALAAVFLIATSATDAYRRLGPGRFAPETALDVIYGPANLRYYSVNVPFLVAAPANRTAQTDAFLREIGAPAGAPVSIAVTEVQLRYFLDERVTVLSLDGRTSAEILTYTDPISGVPDFERYFQDSRPDYVHARQWCAVGGWLTLVLPANIEVNLVCIWERRSERMGIGDSFDWQGRRVTLVTPEIFHIDWSRP